MPPRTSGTPLAMYDLTISCEKFTRDQVIEWMKNYCKRWAFQQEKGSETGYLHFQCRVSLTSKKRPDTMKKFIKETLKGSHVSPTSNPAHHSGNEFYVLKLDTRVDGPWTDREQPKYIPKRFRGVITWYRWQLKLLNFIAEEPDDRTVNVIVDHKGQIGKTFLTMHLSVNRKAERIPAQKDAKDIMRMVMDLPKMTCYFIDLPRATSHKDQNAVYAAIEEIKNGYAYDDRYKFEREYFEPPHIWVFTNQEPDKTLLSKDRWKIWNVVDGDLLPRKELTLSI